MRGFLAVFEREVVERRLLAGAALLLGLVPLAVPWLPGLQQRGSSEVRTATAVALALCCSLGLALLLGASVIVRDLAERRLGFYFSRPIGGAAIWSGKLAAAFALAVSAGLLILLPTAAVERQIDLSGLMSIGLPLPGTAESGLSWVSAVLLLVALSHAASVALRARSPWLFLDFIGLGLVGWGTWAAVRRLGLAGALGAAGVAVAALLAVALLALIAAGAVQVLQGRTDIRRGHRLLSVTLWGILSAGTLAAQGYGSWVLAAQPKDLDEVGLSGVGPRGPWVAIFGPVRHRGGYRPEFLLDTSSGRFARVRFWLPPRFTDDGRWAVWLEPADLLRGTGPYDLLRLDLGDPGSRPERTRMTYSGTIPPILAVSRDGRQAAVATGRRLTIEEVPSGRLLASTELPRELDHVQDTLLLVAPGRVRIFGYEIFSKAGTGLDPGALEVGEIEVGSGGLARVARIEQIVNPVTSFQDPRLPPRLEISGDGTRLLALRRTDRRFVVIDAGNGAVMAELPPAGERSSAVFLADGRIALMTGSSPRELRIFSRAFVPERSFRFAGSGLQVGGQPAPHHLVVATSPRRLGIVSSQSKTLILDLATGAMRQFGSGLGPMPYSQLGPESAGSTLFWRGDGWRLVQVDLETGRERLVAGRPPG